MEGLGTCLSENLNDTPLTTDTPSVVLGVSFYIYNIEGELGTGVPRRVLIHDGVIAGEVGV